MINISKIIFTSLVLTGLSNCSQILEPVELNLDVRDDLKQENFTVVEKTLTLSETNAANSLPFVRLISQTGVQNKARLIPENEVTKSNFPVYSPPESYKVGIGDIITFIKLTDGSNHALPENQTWPNKTLKEPYLLGIGDQVTLTQLNEDIVMPSSLSSTLGGSNSVSGDSTGLKI